jgi:hypothetical protein
MQTLDVRDDLALDTGMRNALAQAIADLERQWPQLPPPIVRPWSDDPVVALDGSTPWLVTPASRDPVFGPDGRAPPAPAP